MELFTSQSHLRYIHHSSHPWATRAFWRVKIVALGCVRHICVLLGVWVAVYMLFSVHTRQMQMGRTVGHWSVSFNAACPSRGDMGGVQGFKVSLTVICHFRCNWGLLVTSSKCQEMIMIMLRVITFQERSTHSRPAHFGDSKAANYQFIYFERCSFTFNDVLSKWTHEWENIARIANVVFVHSDQMPQRSHVSRIPHPT